MWDKIKQYVYGAGALVVAVFAAIFYARGKKIETLEGEVENAKGESNLRKELGDYADAKKRANELEADYRRIRDSLDDKPDGDGAA